MITAKHEHPPVLREDRRSKWITSLVLFGMFLLAIGTIVACTLLTQGSP